MKEEKVMEFLFGKYWKEIMIIIFFGCLGVFYNEYILVKYYEAGSTYGWIELISDKYSLILLQGYLLSAVFIGLPVSYFYYKLSMSSKKKVSKV